MPKTELSTNQRIDWEQKIQLACLKGMSEQPLTMTDMVFHGGTSLRFSWGSPRFSEDLDFMMSQASMAKLEGIVKSALRIATNELQTLDPDFQVTVKEKSRRDGKLQTYMVKLGKKDVIGLAAVKLEFWEVENDFLHSYKSTLRAPQDKFSETRIYSEGLLPVAELRSAYCDKLVALSTRPFLKWRDIFDIWWLRTQNDIDPLKDPEFLPFFQHNLSAYSVPEGMTLEQSLQRYLNWDRNEVLKKSEEDLKRWLSKSLWEKMYPDTVQEMIALVEKDVHRLLHQLAPSDNPIMTPNKPKV